MCRGPGAATIRAMTATTTASPATTSGSGDQFGITLSGVANVVTSVEGLVGSSTGTAGQVASVVLDVLSFAGIGSTVGAQNAALNAKHVESLGKVLELITKIKGLVEQAAQGYADADQATAQGFGGTAAMRDSDLRALVQHERSGDPHALDDRDSEGLVQTIDPTIDDVAAQGHTGARTLHRGAGHVGS